VKGDGITVLSVVPEIRWGRVIDSECSSCATAYSCSHFIEPRNTAQTVKIAVL
jgi:hypothetical protein